MEMNGVDDHQESGSGHQCPSFEGPYASILMEKFRREFQISEDDASGGSSGRREITEEEKDKIRYAKFMEEPTRKPPPKPLPADNLKSAMKNKKKSLGKKKGKSFKPRRVTWADDVYDPTPTSDSHYKPSKSIGSEGDKSPNKKKGKKNWENQEAEAKGGGGGKFKNKKQKGGGGGCSDGDGDADGDEVGKGGKKSPKGRKSNDKKRK